MHRLAHRHTQDIVDALSPILHLKYFGLEAHALTVLTNELDVRKKLHFDRDGAIPLAGVATSTRHIEGKMSGGKSPLVGFRSPGEQVANTIERFDISDRIRSWR